jgi:hypothetical protein
LQRPASRTCLVRSGAGAPVGFLVLAHSAIEYALSAIGITHDICHRDRRGVGRAAVHEFATRFLASTTSRDIDNRTDNTSYEYGTPTGHRVTGAPLDHGVAESCTRSSESEIALATGRLLAGLFRMTTAPLPRPTDHARRPA